MLRYNSFFQTLFYNRIFLCLFAGSAGPLPQGLDGDGENDNDSNDDATVSFNECVSCAVLPCPHHTHHVSSKTTGNSGAKGKQTGLSQEPHVDSAQERAGVEAVLEDAE